MVRNYRELRNLNLFYSPHAYNPELFEAMYISYLHIASYYNILLYHFSAMIIVENQRGMRQPIGEEGGSSATTIGIKECFAGSAIAGYDLQANE